MTPGAGNPGFRPVEGAGWRRGLGNHLDVELGRWFHSRKWWTHTLAFALATIPALILITSSPPQGMDPYRAIVGWFNGLLGVVGALGVLIVMQGAIVGEKRSGTAAWVLSKPISRQAYILAKMLGNAAGIAATFILAQSLIGYAVIYIGYGTAPPLAAVLLAWGPHAVNLLFYLTFALMLGAIFDHWAPVIAIPIMFLFVDEFVELLAPPALFDVLKQLLPYGLATGYGDLAPSIATSVMLGEPPYALAPIIFSLLFSALFVAIAVWVFRRQEL